MGSDDDSEESDDDDEENDKRQMLNELQNTVSKDEDGKGPVESGRRSRTPTSPRSQKKSLDTKLGPTPSASLRSRKTTRDSPPPPAARKKPPSPQRLVAPAVKKRDDENSDDSYFEDEEDEYDDYDDEELPVPHDRSVHNDAEVDQDYDDPEEDEANIVNASVQALRTGRYAPGTQFRVIQDFNGTQTGDLNVRKGDALSLVEKHDDDWWLFERTADRQKGVVPINHVQFVPTEQPRLRKKATTSANTLVDAFKANKNIPDGFIASDLAPLIELEEYQLWRTMVPAMSESNLAFADLHWRPDKDELRVQEVTYQKVLTLKQCVKVPRIKGEQVQCIDLKRVRSQDQDHFHPTRFLQSLFEEIA